MIINFFVGHTSAYLKTINFEKVNYMDNTAVHLDFHFDGDDKVSIRVGNPMALAEYITTYYALGEKLISVEIDDEEKLGFSISPMREYYVPVPSVDWETGHVHRL